MVISLVAQERVMWFDSSHVGSSFSSIMMVIMYEAKKSYLRSFLRVGADYGIFEMLMFALS